MAEILKGELQDYQGNTLYPHTDSDVVFCTDGQTVQDKLAKIEGVLGNTTGKSSSLEVSNANILATTEATHQLAENVNALNNNGVITGLTFDGTNFFATGKVEGADAVTKKLGNGELVAEALSSSASATHKVAKAGKYVVVAMAFSKNYADNGSTYGSLTIKINDSNAGNITTLTSQGNQRQGIGKVTKVYELAVGDTIKVSSSGQQDVKSALIYLEDQ